MSEKEPYAGLVRRKAIEAGEDSFSHPWNPDSEIIGTHLSGITGLERTGVSRVRIPPGKESFAYHLHHREEEWIYILSGRGVAVVDGDEFDMSAGDFIAFPAPSVAHNMTNPFDEELVYLMGGENRKFELADFPDLDRRMVRNGDKIEIYRLSDGKPFGPLED